ncbi:MAG: helix-turn-helix domain-containing protein [Chitinophagales bacterium]|nr:helix-turn-helix domain-containing protein [Chitinophagales bacterium]
MTYTYRGQGGAFLELTDLKGIAGAHRSAMPAGYFTFIWNKCDTTHIEVDGIEHPLSHNKMVSLTPVNYLKVIAAGNATVIRFNRDFYCIKEHDHEVSCVGLLFFGSSSVPIIAPEEDDIRRLNALYQVLVEEFTVNDHIQGEMLQMLLKRWIIINTRLVRGKVMEVAADNNLEMVRQFNVAVEMNFRKLHKVADYAALLNRSPKTLSNIFTKAIGKSPMEVIQERIVLEARRLLMYTDKPVKEIAADLGFEEVSGFSRLFKGVTSIAPADYKKWCFCPFREKSTT